MWGGLRVVIGGGSVGLLYPFILMLETWAKALQQGVFHFQLKLGFCYENTHMYRSLSEKISEYPQKKPKVLMLFGVQPELKLNEGVIVF